MIIKKHIKRFLLLLVFILLNQLFFYKAVFGVIGNKSFSYSYIISVDIGISENLNTSNNLKKRNIKNNFQFEYDAMGRRVFNVSACSDYLSEKNSNSSKAGRRDHYGKVLRDWLNANNINKTEKSCFDYSSSMKEDIGSNIVKFSCCNEVTKVQYASWVGLGWDLKPGGKIYKSLKVQVDFCTVNNLKDVCEKERLDYSYNMRGWIMQIANNDRNATYFEYDKTGRNRKKSFFLNSVKKGEFDFFYDTNIFNVVLSSFNFEPCFVIALKIDNNLFFKHSSVNSCLYLQKKQNVFYTNLISNYFVFSLLNTCIYRFNMLEKPFCFSNICVKIRDFSDYPFFEGVIHWGYKPKIFYDIGSCYRFSTYDEYFSFYYLNKIYNKRTSLLHKINNKRTSLLHKINNIPVNDSCVEYKELECIKRNYGSILSLIYKSKKQTPALENKRHNSNCCQYSGYDWILKK